MRNHLSLVLSSTAFLLALFGATPLGLAAEHAVTEVVPFAKQAAFAKRAAFADNAAKLNGHRASTAPGAGQIPVVRANGKLPVSLGAIGPQGLQGASGPTGPTGPTGPSGPTGTIGVSGLELVTSSSSLGQQQATLYVKCPVGKTALGGGYQLPNGTTAFQSSPDDSLHGWSVGANGVSGQFSSTVFAYVICATVS